MDGTVSVLHRGKEVLFKGWQHYWLIQLRPADLLDLQSESVSPTKTLLGAACVNVYDPRASLSESRAASFLGLLLQGIGWVTLQKRRQMETRREEGAGWRVWWAPFKMGDRNVLWRVLCVYYFVLLQLIPKQITISLYSTELRGNGETHMLCHSCKTPLYYFPVYISFLP